jgi:endothelin-converting enzyme/putative endopeptidase
LGTLGIDAPFGFSGDQDLRDASIVIGHIDQGGLGLPDKDYYLTEDAKKKEVRTKYQEHMQRLFVLLGDKPDTAKKNAATVMKIETLLAKASMSREERRDPKKLHNRLERSGLAKAAPTIAWDQFLTGVGAKDLQTINVLNPTFIKAVDGMVKSVPAGEWRTYFRAHTVHALADALPTGFQEEGFRMRSALLGLAKQPERWKRCVRAADHAMGEALGQGFAKATLGSEGKAKTRSMIAAIEKAMEQNLGALPWMDEATRARAAQKLASITNKVAYPDKWRNYDALTIASGEHAHNVMRANVFEFERRVARIGKPVDRDEWGMTPPTVNAYYNPLLNEMVFPAGILQPPFYSNNFTTPTNYGAIGMVMGHELTHGFDDEGRQFDAKGNLSDWWTPPVNAEFEKRASCVEKQFSSYVAIGEERINGKLTLGENIADLGGIKLAYAAMRAELGKTANTSESTVGGFSADQQLFLGFAQSWCSNEREQWLRMRLAADPHSPARFRVNGPLSNMKEFAAAFQCKSGDKMVREGADRCEVW